MLKWVDSVCYALLMATPAVLPDVLPANRFPKSGEVGPRLIKRLMPWFESYWHEFHRYPSNAEIISRYGFTLEQVQILESSKFWLQSLDRRGIGRPGRTDLYLTDRQIAAVSIITNFSDTRPLPAKLANAGITEQELDGYYKDPKFAAELKVRSEEILGNVQPNAVAELARQINRGSFPALKFYMEITGQAASPEAINAKKTLQLLIEVVQKHVKNQDTLDAIGDEMQSLIKIQGL